MAVKKPPVVLSEFGSTGLRRFRGLVDEEFHIDLKGKKGAKAYREMRDNSARVGACLGATEMILRQASWHVEPFSQDAEDLMRAEHVNTCRNDMSQSWPETIAEHLSMLTYGWAYHEIVYKIRGGDVNDPTMRSRYNDGRIGWRKIPLRSQDSLHEWVLDDPGGVQAMLQMAPPDYRLRRIPIEKALHFRAKSEKNNPEGRSPLRNAYFPWYFAKHMTTIEAMGVERDLTGLPVGWAPAECMDENAPAEMKAAKDAFVELLRDIKRDEQEYALLPYQVDERGNPRWKMELLASPGKRQHDTGAIIERHNGDIATTILYDLVLMGQPNQIKYQGKDMPSIFAVALAGWLDTITEIYNTHAIPRLMRLNGWPTDRLPRLAHGDVEVPDLAALGDYLTKLSGAGMPLFPNPALEEHLLRVAKLPKPDPNAKPKAAPMPAFGEPPADPDPSGDPPPEKRKSAPPPDDEDDDDTDALLAALA